MLLNHFYISLGWIYTSETVRTNAQHEEPGLLGSFASIRGGSTLPNQPYMVNSNEFGVIQCFQTFSKYSVTLRTRLVGDGFNVSKPFRTTV